MGAINFFFFSNFAIFSVFATLLLTETMGSLLLLARWGKYKGSVLPYIIPIWEVTGTFGAFWVVSSDFSFPSILIPVAGIFSFAIMVFLILFVARNSSIAFAEFIEKKGWLDEKKLFQIYSVSSILIALVVLTIVTGIMGGNGIDFKTLTFSAVSWIQNPSGIVFIIGALLLAVGFSPIFYNDPEIAKVSMILVIAGIIVSDLSVEMIKNWTVGGILLVPDVLSFLMPLLFYFKVTRRVIVNKTVFIVWLSVNIFTLNFVVYPSAFGGRIPIDSITNGSAMAGSYEVLTIAGSVLLAVLVFLYATAVRRKGMELNNIQSNS